MSQRILTAVLARPGWAVECVRDAREALARFATESAGFDVLVTDHAMPELDGAALIERLRGRGYRGPVIVVSAGIGPREVAHYRGIGVQFILLKPIGAARLRLAVETALGLVQPANAGGARVA